LRRPASTWPDSRDVGPERRAAAAEANTYKNYLDLLLKNIIAKKKFGAIFTPLLHAEILHQEDMPRTARADFR
jgi:hypothetical protein